MYSGTRRFGLGDALDLVAGDSLANAYAGDPQLAQLHQLALLMVALRQNYDAYLNLAADASYSGAWDPNVLTTIATQLEQYNRQFQTLRAAIDRTTVDQNALNAFDQAFLDVGSWAAGAVQAFPTAVAAIPNALVDALGNVARNTGRNLASSLVIPGVIVGIAAVAVLAFVRGAERTRTGRALTRRI